MDEAKSDTNRAMENPYVKDFIEKLKHDIAKEVESLDPAEFDTDSPREEVNVSTNAFGKLAQKLGFNADYYTSRKENDHLVFSPNKWLYWLLVLVFGGMFYFNYEVDQIKVTLNEQPPQNLVEPSSIPKAVPAPPEKLLSLIAQSEDFAQLDSLEEFFFLFPVVLDDIPSAMPLLKKKTVLTSPYGVRNHPIHKISKKHFGIDLAAALNAPVFSTANGTVISSVESDQGHGNHIIIEHANGFKTLYGHLNQILVENGQPISAHDIIGLVGSTGVSTGPHLHYEVIKNDERVDPIASFNLKYKILSTLK